ncbi:transmembrane protein 52 isoform X1 [Cuculus canorus]|uniref:transmembrane protein 52 isoform X1 n=1 Tax=Cuculus canorus TaxID=55661 RepID=UPI0023AADC6F|nr:transmembrane protein 52 isoform X1 [Cuculus canorus]
MGQTAAAIGVTAAAKHSSVEFLPRSINTRGWDSGVADNPKPAGRRCNRISALRLEHGAQVNYAGTNRSSVPFRSCSMRATGPQGNRSAFPTLCSSWIFSYLCSRSFSVLAGSVLSCGHASSPGSGIPSLWRHPLDAGGGPPGHLLPALPWGSASLPEARSWQVAQGSAWEQPGLRCAPAELILCFPSAGHRSVLRRTTGTLSRVTCEEASLGILFCD